MIKFGDTIAAPATIPGTGAVTIIRVSGPQALQTAEQVVSLKSGKISAADGYTLHFGNVSGLDDVLVSVFRAVAYIVAAELVSVFPHR